jgi:sugar/nucleoside kinase (ribokinase family)
MDNNKKFDTVVLGELNVDIILSNIKCMPEIGKEILADEMTVTLGSSSAIFASNLSSLGANVAFVGKIGVDHFASVVLESLRSKKVDTSAIRRSEKLNTGATIVLNYDQDRAMVTYPGAMNDFKLSDIDFQFIGEARHLHFSSCFLQPGIRNDLKEIFQKAKQMGLSTSLDPQWDPNEKWDMNWTDLLPFVDIFLPNAEEIQQLTRRTSINDAVDKLKSVARNIVIKNGDKGAYLWDGNKLIHQPVFHNGHIVDCIGAGDSFNAGFIYRYLQKCPLQDCLEFGALTGAINTTKAGGTGAFSTIKEIRKIAKQQFEFQVL